MRYKNEPAIREQLFKGIVPDETLGAAYAAEVTKALDGKLGAKGRAFDFVISTGIVDRDGDRLNPDGWQFKDFLAAGGPVLFGHDAKRLPIGKTTSIAVVDGKVKARPEFMPQGEYDLADLTVKCIEFGSCKAASVGYLPKRGRFKKNSEGGIDFDEQDMLEYSILPIPSNPEALALVKAAGVSLAPLGSWVEDVLDSAGFFAELEKAHGLTKEAALRVLKLATGERVSVSVDAPAAPAPGAAPSPAPAVDPSVAVHAAGVAPGDSAKAKGAFPGAAPPFGKPKDDEEEDPKKPKPKKDDKKLPDVVADEEEEIDCPKCGKPMVKGKACPECGYKEKEKAPLSIETKDDVATRVFFEEFVKCGMEAVPYAPPPPPEAMTFDEIIEKREAEKLSWQAQDLQWTFMDSVRSILAAAPAGQAVPLLRATLGQYSAALGKLEPEKAADARTKAGRVFSRANEAALRELAKIQADALAALNGLLAQVAPNPTPEGEANFPNVLGPGATGGEKKPKPRGLVIVDDVTPRTSKAPVGLRIVARPGEIEELERKSMMERGRLPAPKSSRTA